MLSVIIPANDEAGWIGPCLDGLLAQTLPPGAMEVVVAANACTDETVAIARSREAAFAAKGWRLEVLDIPEGGKPNAFDRGDAAATGGMRAYLDADVVCSPELMAQVAAALARPEPAYATGRLEVAPARTWVTRAYGRLWRRLPFMTGDAPGAGLFAVNAAGRARWGAFPRIISDDTYVRLLFAPGERVQVEASYSWPMVEGFRNLVRVRRRQDEGVEEIRALNPAAMANEAKAPLGAGGALRLFAQAPVDFAVYAAVRLAVRLDSALDGALSGGGKGAWARGR